MVKRIMSRVSWWNRPGWITAVGVLVLAIILGVSGASVLCAATTTEQTVTYMAYLSIQQAKALEKLTDAFYRETGIRVKLLNVPWDEVWTKMKLMVAAGDPPDVYGGGIYAYDIAATGALVDLNPLIKRDKVSLVDFFTAGLAAPRYGSMQYGLPYSFNTYYLYYNADMVDQAGLRQPGTWGDSSWTWDRFAEYAKKMTKDTNNDGTPDIFGGAALAPLDIPWMFGTGWLSPDLKQVVVDSPGGIKSFQFTSDLIYKHKVLPTESQWAAAGWGITQGKVAMAYGGTWSLTPYIKTLKKFRWNVAAVPIGTNLPPGGGYAIPSYPDGFILFKGGNTEAAWEWVKFVLFNEENLKYFTANVVGQMPPTATLLRWWAEALKKDAPFLDLATVLRAPEFAQVQLLFFTKRTHEIQTLIGQAGSEILGPNADVEALVKQLAAKIRQMID